MTHLRQAMLDELHRRNYAASTIVHYVKNVEQFARYFKRSPDRLTHTHLRTYQAHLLRQRKLAPRTVKLHVCAIRFFFNKILQRRYVLDDTPYPKVPRRLPQILSHEEVTCLIAAAHSLTHRTMLMLLCSTGIRNAELRHLRVQDIDSRRMLIHIRHGKGSRDRYVPLSAALLDTLRAYYRWMRPTTYLFAGTVANWRADKPLTPKVVWDACGRGPPRWAAETSVPIYCATRTRRICSKPARTCAQFNCCSATPISITPSSICTCRSGTCTGSPILSTRSCSRHLTRSTSRGGCTSGDAATLRGGRPRAPTRRSLSRDAPGVADQPASARPSGSGPVPHGRAGRASRSL